MLKAIDGRGEARRSGRRSDWRSHGRGQSSNDPPRTALDVDIDLLEPNRFQPRARYDDQRLDSRRLGVGLQARFDLAADAELFGEVAREKDFEDDGSEVGMALNSVSAVDFTLRGAEPDRYLTRAVVGLRQLLAPGLALQLGYDYRQSGENSQQGVSAALVMDW